MEELFPITASNLLRFVADSDRFGVYFVFIVSGALQVLLVLSIVCVSRSTWACCSFATYNWRHGSLYIHQHCTVPTWRKITICRWAAMQWSSVVHGQIRPRKYVVGPLVPTFEQVQRGGEYAIRTFSGREKYPCLHAPGRRMVLLPGCASLPDGRFGTVRWVAHCR